MSWLDILGSQEKTLAGVPTKTAEQAEAERIIARGQRLKRLSEEAAMWRSFATGVQPGRYVCEYTMVVHAHPCLQFTVDEHSAEPIKAFAIYMAEDRERRVREMLGS